MALSPAQSLLRTPPVLRTAKKLSDTSYPFLAPRLRRLVLAMTPFGGADNKSPCPPNSEGAGGSWDHSVDDPGPSAGHGCERGKLVFQSPGIMSRQHLIEGEAPGTFGAGVSQASIVACASVELSKKNKKKGQNTWVMVAAMPQGPSSKSVQKKASGKPD